MALDSELGMLASLPRELRDEIWRYLSMQTGFTYLQASRQVYDEAFPTIYNDAVLHFHVSLKYQYKSWLDLENNIGVKWPLTSLDGSIKRGFGNLPYHKLKSIQINIEAPELRDPGQVLCLHKKCTNLAELLEQAK